MQSTYIFFFFFYVVCISVIKIKKITNTLNFEALSNTNLPFEKNTKKSLVINPLRTGKIRLIGLSILHDDEDFSSLALKGLNV